jgi:hypothetical protein
MRVNSRLLLSFLIISLSIVSASLLYAHSSAYLSTSIAITVSSIILSILLLITRTDVINSVIISVVVPVYYAQPFSFLFYDGLTKPQLDHMNIISHYYTPESSEYAYWNLVMLLASWLLGLAITNSFKQKLTIQIPKIFLRIDGHILKRGALFWLVVLLLMFANYQPADQMYAGLKGENAGISFLYGMANITIFAEGMLFFYIYSWFKDIRLGKKLILLFPIITIAFLSAMSGSRGGLVLVLFSVGLYSMVMILNKNKLYLNFKKISLLILTIPIALLITIGATVLRSTIAFESSSRAMKGLFIYINQFVDGDFYNQIAFPMAIITNRIGSLFGQLVVFSDKYYVDPWWFYNPFMLIGRILNLLIPGGDPIQGISSTYKVFNYVFYNQEIIYSSEQIGIEGLLYIYYGYAVSYLVVFIMSVIYGLWGGAIEKIFMQSPFMAYFYITVLRGFILTGNPDDIFVNNIVKFMTLIIILSFLFRLNKFIKYSNIRNDIH